MVQEEPLLTFIFDGSCDFCTLATRIIRVLDWRRRVLIRPFQQPGVAARHGLAIAQCEAAAWAIKPDGTRYHSAAAINQTLTAALGTRLPWLIYSLPGIRELQEAVYALVARNRSHIPGVKPHCQQYPHMCR